MIDRSGHSEPNPALTEVYRGMSYIGNAMLGRGAVRSEITLSDLASREGYDHLPVEDGQGDTVVGERFGFDKDGSLDPHLSFERYSEIVSQYNTRQEYRDSSRGPIKVTEKPGKLAGQLAFIYYPADGIYDSNVFADFYDSGAVGLITQLQTDMNPPRELEDLIDFTNRLQTTQREESESNTPRGKCVFVSGLCTMAELVPRFDEWLSMALEVP